MPRSLKKGPFVEEKLLKKAESVRRLGVRQAIKTWSRASTIIPDFVGLTFA
ncbi:MAG: ribosomal protein S19 family protein, partial [Candidatus Omnitrophica bacterium]|nr:ribosomal protein S19 family protein [Candidatus Omnitrophota bacterium]